MLSPVLQNYDHALGFPKILHSKTRTHLERIPKKYPPQKQL